MKQALVAVALLAVMTSLLVMFKKRVDAEADGTAYQTSHDKTLGDHLFGRGPYAGGRALGTGASDGDESPGAGPLATALGAITAGDSDAGDEAEAANDETGAASDDGPASEGATDADVAAATDPEPDEADASAPAAAPEAFGLARAIGGDDDPLDTGEPEGFADRRRTVDESVVIEAPIEQVWAYVGDSLNAREWSVYFHHISPLPGVPDGQVGALRRCFRNEDETGRRWDERLVAVVPNRLRKIHVFDLHGFWPESANGIEHTVWQVYEPLGPDRTRLTFRSEPATTGAKATLSALLSKGRSAKTFKQNLENIKAAVEQGARYRRPHAYWD